MENQPSLSNLVLSQLFPDSSEPHELLPDPVMHALAGLDQDNSNPLGRTTKFDSDEIHNLYDQFNSVAKNGEPLKKDHFFDLLNLMGVRIKSQKATRIFLAIDADLGGTIDFVEFMTFFNILVHGSQDQKDGLTFSLLDCGHKGYFDLSDVKGLMSTMFEAEYHPDGGHKKSDEHSCKCPLSEEERKEVQDFSEFIFEKLKVPKSEDGKEWCTKEHFLGRLKDSTEVRGMFEELGNTFSGKKMKFAKKNRFSNSLTLLDQIENIFIPIQKVVKRMEMLSACENQSAIHENFKIPQLFTMARAISSRKRSGLEIPNKFNSGQQEINTLYPQSLSPPNEQFTAFPTIPIERHFSSIPLGTMESATLKPVTNTVEHLPENADLEEEIFLDNKSQLAENSPA
jgi:Ca2+-binding EF-hand superfamily protein